MSIRKFRASRVNTTNANIYVGQPGDIFYDEVTGQLKISDGHTAGGHFINLVIATSTVAGAVKAGPGATIADDGTLTIDTAGLPLNVGDLSIVQANISTVHTNEDLNLITNGTGDINIVGNLHIHTTAQGPDYPVPILAADNYGNVTVNGNLIINGKSYFVGNIVEIGNLTVTGNTVNNGVTTFNGATIINGDTTRTGNTLQSGNVTITGNSVNTGTSTFNGASIFNGNVTTTGNLIVTGNTAMVGNVVQQGNLTINGVTINNGLSVFNGNIAMVGNAVIAGNTNITGNTLVTGNTQIIGSAYLTGNSYVTGNTFVTGTTTVTGNTTVTGAATTITGNAYLTGNSYITGNTFVTGTTNVTGNLISQGGSTTILAPGIASGTAGALNIVGSGDGTYMPVTGAGGMIHITGNPDTLVRLTMDGFLTSGSGAQTFGGAAAGYGTISMRTARGTVASPLPVLQDDLIGNYSALGWVGSSARYSPNQVAGLQFLAAETFTNATATGTYAIMRLAPTGSNAGVVSTTFYANGIVTGNLVAGNVIANTIGTLTGNVSGTILTASQPNITSVGTLTSLAVTGNVSAGNVLVGATTYANLSITSTASGSDFTIGQVGATGNLILNRNTNFTKDAFHQGNIRYDSSQNNATASGFNKAGGTPTAHGRTGQLTTNADSIAKSAAATFTVTNNYIVSAKDVVIVNIASGGTTNSYAVSITAVAPGSFSVTVTNSGTGALAEALVINFAVIRVS